MEKESLIKLIEEDDDDLEEQEDNDHETDRVKKRHLLASMIINFITNKRDRTDDKEEAILDSLFDPSTKDQAEQLESLAGSTDEVVFATIVVDSRIDQLKQDISLEVDTDQVDEKLGKIKALNEIRDYLVIDDQIYQIETTKPSVNELNSTKLQVDQAPAVKSKETEPPKKRSKTKKISNKISHAQPKRTLEQHPRTEIVNNSHVVSKNEVAPRQPSIVIDNNEALNKTRNLIEKLYSEQKPTKAIKPETIVNFVQPKITQERYQDISRKIIVDNMSLRQFFNKNHFSEKARSRIISEILNGEKPAKALGREVNKRGKFKQLIKSYSQFTPATSDQQTRTVSESSSLAVKKAMVKNSSTNLSFYSPRIWSIIIVAILIVILILFIVF